MRTKPVKKKMKRLPEASDRAKHFREALGMSQNQFAEHTGIARPRISEWEAGKGVPSAEACVLLGNEAPYPENLWFWEQAGLDLQVNLSAAEKELKKRGAAPAPSQIVRVPFMERTPQGWKETGSELPLPAELVPNPGSTICFTVDEKSAGYAFAAGDIVVIEPADDERDPRPFWGQVVLFDFDPAEVHGWQSGIVPEGLFIGLLRCIRYRPSSTDWVADIVSLSPRSHSDRIFLASWKYKPPLDLPESPKEEEETNARKGIDKVMEGCKIIGRSIAWFRPPRPVRE